MTSSGYSKGHKSVKVIANRYRHLDQDRRVAVLVWPMSVWLLYRRTGRDPVGAKEDANGRKRIQPVGDHVGYRRHSKEARPLHRCLLYTSPSPRDRTRSRMP